MTTLSTHVLDAAQGTPRADLEVVLTRGADGAELERVRTDADGRARFAGDLDGGHHALTFATATAFHPVVRVDVTVDATEAHHHVALLLSPFAYTTYKGS
ncbi:hydroxyisourate hydrolase [Nocardioides sp. zg-579]|uniref:Hydroxyisourate hydrolase n=1 Tax=Nocardioides marmotae TaxID=2663857 RepID=A0A6I3J4Z7_9ACTN|nr:hydroxyisourate hydrolase [Nocardioides marmotae]MCR6030606.1 hydroxyisourate hydrolase [Gordonia jinghuaiqii]MTB94242.1 hydroxyisourate hydrolase [Nocardioides marmotae]QKE00521.1 hydroxyisourate hydrolase [Nocardioides marmotae]